MVVQFYNTFIRLSINEKNVRAVFNILYQYRKLNESIFEYSPELSAKVIFYFKYYGDTCLQQGLWFVMYTVAFDIANMLITAYQVDLANIEELLAIFLGLEDNMDPKKDALAFTGVRKSQIILAAYLFSLGETDLIQLIVDDLAVESRTQLIQWKDQVLGVASKTANRGSKYRPFL